MDKIVEYRDDHNIECDGFCLQVYNSGLPFSIVRVGAPGDSLTPAGNVEVTAAGGTSKGAALSRAQVGRPATSMQT